MFLNQLSEKEKDAFVSLSIHVSNSDGIFADEERIMIQEYCREMGISFFDANNAKTMDEIVEIFSASEDRIKKIVLLEVLGLVYCDGLFDEKEKTFIKEYASKIGLSDEQVELQVSVIKEYFGVIKKISKCIN